MTLFANVYIHLSLRVYLHLHSLTLEVMRIIRHLVYNSVHIWYLLEITVRISRITKTIKAYAVYVDQR